MAAGFRPYVPDGATLVRFLADDSMVRGLMGPWGSGKSVCCVQDILNKARGQNVNPVDGVRRSRVAIIRQTMVELRATTQKTWFDWIPKSAGAWRDSGPPRHLVRFKQGVHAHGPLKGRDDIVELEALFIALDHPDDASILDSLELTMAWGNEGRHLVWDAIKNLVGRTSRYPSKSDGGSRWGFRVIYDTNPPPVNSWWFDKFEKEKPDKWRIFKQPSGRSPLAENLHWLEDCYYDDLQLGQTAEWINVYVDGQYGYTGSGKRVFPEFNEHQHLAKIPLQIIPELPVIVGLDAGLTPAAGFWQHPANGQWRGLAELVTEPGAGMGSKRFSEHLTRVRHERFDGRPVDQFIGWADPSAAFGADTQAGELTWIQSVAAHSGFRVRPAPTNQLSTRLEAVRVPLTRLIDGTTPGLIIGANMVTTHEAFIDGYRFRRLKVTGDTRYADEPDKNKSSHIMDGHQYALLGGGEYAQIIGAKGNHGQTPREAPNEHYDPHAW